jgi:hypothetical protein
MCAARGETGVLQRVTEPLETDVRRYRAGDVIEKVALAPFDDRVDMVVQYVTRGRRAWAAPGDITGFKSCRYRMWLGGSTSSGSDGPRTVSVLGIDEVEAAPPGGQRSEVERSVCLSTS